MDLSRFIPNGENWSLSKGVIYFKKIQRIPLCMIIDDVPHIILENKIPKKVIELTKMFMKIGEEFYFTTPLAINPSGVEKFKDEVIRSYFISYSNIKFFHGFKKISFDLIKNLIDWSEKNDAWYLVKPVYEDINKTIQKKYHDYWQKKDYYDFDYEIREEFRTLWREIQINKII
jgi:hypothetical protein